MDYLLICKLYGMNALHKWIHRPNLYPVSIFSVLLVIILLITYVGQSKNKGAEQLAHILALEKTVEDYQSHVDELKNDLVNDHISGYVDYNLQLAAAKGLLVKATQALMQKKNALGMSAQTDLYLLRNNKWLQTQTNAQALKI